MAASISVTPFGTTNLIACGTPFSSPLTELLSAILGHVRFRNPSGLPPLAPCLPGTAKCSLAGCDWLRRKR